MKKRILVIDDDPLVLKSLFNLLTRAGYEVDFVKNGKEAEQEVNRKTFHLIISDIRMPQQDGISTIQNLKRHCLERNGIETPFLFITGYASEEAPIDAIKLGAKDYLLKPFDMNELLQSIARNIQ